MRPRFSAPVLIALIAFNSLGAQQRVIIDTPDGVPPRAITLASPLEVKLEPPGLANTTLPVVAVMINGRGPFRAAIETGAGFVGATRAFADSAGLRATGTKNGMTDYMIDSVRIGGARFDGVKLSELPRGASGVDLILGLAFFQDVLLTIDYPAGVMRISRDSLAQPNGRDIFSISHVGPFWGLPISIGGQALTAVLDTRSAAPTMSTSPSVASKLPFADSLRVIGKAGGAGFAPTEVKEGRLAGDIKVGAYTFSKPLISVRELPPGFPTNPLFGDPMLRYFEMSLDQRHARLALRRHGDSVIVLPEPQRTPGTNATPGGSSATIRVAKPEEYVGRYANRTITTSDGKLFLLRDGGDRLEMAPIDRDAFSLAEIPAARIEFDRDATGAVTAMRVMTQPGTWERALRSAPNPELSRSERDELLTAIGRLLADNYVFADSGRRFAAVLEQKRSTDAYRGLAEPGQFAAAVTKDLRAVSHDHHISILSPETAKELFVPSGGRTSTASPLSAERAKGYYFEHFQNLAGNVGYLHLRQFPAPDSAARATAAAAMTLLANADAIILDLRDNPGGVEGLSQFLSSYFFADSSLVLYYRYLRRGDSTTAKRVLASLPGPRILDAPLFILVNGHTGSAAENMAYALQTRGRATVVGENTAGAANSSTVMPLPQGFLMQVPIGRVISPVTKTNWEGVGVQPDIRARSDSAALVAYHAALRRLLATSTDSSQRVTIENGLLSHLPASLDPPESQPARVEDRPGI